MGYKPSINNKNLIFINTIILTSLPRQIVETKRRACVKLAACWLLSFLLYSPVILLWDVVRGHSIVPPDDCDVEFNQHLPFTIAIQSLAFSLPFLSLTVLNTMLFARIRKMVRKVTHHSVSSPIPQGSQQQHHRSQQQSHSREVRVSDALPSPSRERRLTESPGVPVQDVNGSRPKQFPTRVTLTESLGVPAQDVNGPRPKEFPTRERRLTESSGVLPQDVNGSQSKEFPAPDGGRRDANNSSRASSSWQAPSAGNGARLEARGRERRVAFMLTGMVLALVVCWLPYSVSTIVLAACPDCVDPELYMVFNWLLWFKSCVNPFLYAYMSPRFRQNFQGLLTPALPARWTGESSRGGGGVVRGTVTDTMNTVNTVSGRT